MNKDQSQAQSAPDLDLDKLEALARAAGDPAGDFKAVARFATTFDPDAVLALIEQARRATAPHAADLHKDVEWLTQCAEEAVSYPEVAMKIRNACRVAASHAAPIGRDKLAKALRELLVDCRLRIADGDAVRDAQALLDELEDEEDGAAQPSAPQDTDGFVVCGRAGNRRYDLEAVLRDALADKSVAVPGQQQQQDQASVMPPFAAPVGQHSVDCPDCRGTGRADSGGVHPWGEPAMIPCGCDDLRTAVARAIWNIRREDEDRCDMELEDMGESHEVWSEADAAIDAASGFREGRNAQAESSSDVAEAAPQPVGALVAKGELLTAAHREKIEADLRKAWPAGFKNTPSKAMGQLIWATEKACMAAVTAPTESAAAPADQSEAREIVRDLRITAGMVSMGEQIAWGSDTSLMSRAADFITSHFLATPTTQQGGDHAGD